MREGEWTGRCSARMRQARALALPLLPPPPDTSCAPGMPASRPPRGAPYPAMRDARAGRPRACAPGTAAPSPPHPAPPPLCSTRAAIAAGAHASLRIDNGKCTYNHQALGAVMVLPAIPPLRPEAWDEFMAALRRGPPPEQVRAVERALEIGRNIRVRDASTVPIEAYGPQDSVRHGRRPDARTGGKACCQPRPQD